MEQNDKDYFKLENDYNKACRELEEIKESNKNNRSKYEKILNNFNNISR